jgi:hypothetical protein
MTLRAQLINAGVGIRKTASTQLAGDRNPANDAHFFLVTLHSDQCDRGFHASVVIQLPRVPHDVCQDRRYTYDKQPNERCLELPR